MQAALGSVTTADAALFKWRPGSCKLRALLSDQTQWVSHLPTHLLAATDSSPNTFTSGFESNGLLSNVDPGGELGGKGEVQNVEDSIEDHSLYKSRVGPYEGSGPKTATPNPRTSTLNPQPLVPQPDLQPSRSLHDVTIWNCIG